MHYSLKNKMVYDILLGWEEENSLFNQRNETRAHHL